MVSSNVRYRVRVSASARTNAISNARAGVRSKVGVNLSDIARSIACFWDRVGVRLSLGLGLGLGS
jgi:hypothetical protein